MSSELTKNVKKSELSLYLERPEIYQNIVDVLKDEAKTFATSILSLAGADAKLKECNPGAVVKEAMKAAVLGLPIEKALGFAYVIPYNENIKVGNSWTKVMTPHFQMGYKGYIQLAKNTKLIVKMSTTVIKEGELKYFDPIKEDYEFEIIQDAAKRAKTPTAGYVFYFKEVHGFEKLVYMTKDQVVEHGRRYSKTFGYDNSLWKTDIDAMGLKTVIIQGLSKWATLKASLSKALATDDDYRTLESDDNQEQLDPKNKIDPIPARPESVKGKYGKIEVPKSGVDNTNPKPSDPHDQPEDDGGVYLKESVNKNPEEPEEYDNPTFPWET